MYRYFNNNKEIKDINFYITGSPKDFYELGLTVWMKLLMYYKL